MEYTIVLSAYDGAPYLDAQIESIRAQTAREWRLLVRDDGSSDDTHRRLCEWAAREPRIDLLPRDGRNLGPAASFGVLLRHAVERDSRHVFLSDQDDVWVAGKCERMLAAMAAREAAVGSGVPLLLHSDLRVVGSDLAEIHRSFAALQQMDPADARAPARLLLRNSVTGCATLVNAALLRCALPMPGVAMHDWWLAQCAAAFGEVHFVPEALVLYRQHGRNAVGARGLLVRTRDTLRSPRAWWSESAQRFLAGLRQVWVIRARARAMGLRMVPGVERAADALWRGLGEGPMALRSRLAAAVRSGALPGPLPMRLLVLARVAALPRLRARWGDERRAIGTLPE
jgi:rhamnosyltransferase